MIQCNQSFLSFIVSDERSAGAKRDIKIKVRGGNMEFVNELHRSYDALQYPILFPRGQDGYDVDKKEKKLTNTTSCQFYAYQFQIRQNDFNTLLKTRMLMSQFCVDMYAKVTL